MYYTINYSLHYFLIANLPGEHFPKSFVNCIRGKIYNAGKCVIFMPGEAAHELKSNLLSPLCLFLSKCLRVCATKIALE